MSWSPQQDAALKAVKAWINSPSSPQVFRLFGFAGTGKTTLAKEITTFVKGKTLFACFMGKAALVLRKKGCVGASTIHSLIYKPEENDVTGEVEFVLNPISKVADVKLVIIDEVSQVNDVLGLDLLSFGTKILVLGDPAQLPPVNGEGFFINQKPDIMLTEIHRQAQDNPIIRLSMDVREGRHLELGHYGDSRVMRYGEVSKEEMASMALDADQILCGLNGTRHAMNTRVRQLKGMGGLHFQTGNCFPYPTEQDRLVCLKNNKEKGLLNGGLWEAIHVDLMAQFARIRVASLDEPERSPIDVDVLYPFFDGNDKLLHWRTKKGFDEFTYSYALTVHKSQGSQWDDVLLFDESRTFREDWRKHLYTGITRAAEKITIVI